MTETANNNAAAEPAIHSPGQQLREARESLGLTAQEAAVKLHLHQRIVTWLEADEFDQLPSPIYVRGYLRNYARLLGLDPEKIVAAYDGSESEYPDLKPPLTAPSQASSSDKLVKAVTYLVTLVLVLLLLAWWQSRHVSDDSFMNLENLQVSEGNNATSASDEGGEETRDTSLGYPIKVIRHPDSTYYPRPDEPQSSSQTAGGSPGEPTNQPTGEIPDTATTPAPLLENLPEPDSGTDSVATDTSTAATGAEPAETASNTDTESAADTAATDTETSAATGTSDADGLQLDLTEESWIEVYAADGERLYMGLGKPGDTIRVDGQAPLRVLLGYAPGVEVTYDGETIDAVEYSSAGVADFTVGP